ncbi:hypothetical protein QUQ58_004884 [Escherichia coli]|nr:hypothetical protein [Escherichia coli]
MDFPDQSELALSFADYANHSSAAFTAADHIGNTESTIIPACYEFHNSPKFIFNQLNKESKQQELLHFMRNDNVNVFKVPIFHISGKSLKTVNSYAMFVSLFYLKKVTR